MHAETPSAFIEVPFHCPLPAYCPICGSPGEKTRRVRAWEGIPLIFTYHLSVGVPYCRSHYEQLAGLEMRQRLAIWGILLCPLISVLPALAIWSLRWLFPVGCFASIVCLWVAADYGMKVTAARGVKMRTVGNWPGYRLYSLRPDWNQKLEVLVEQFKKTHEKKG